MLWDIGEMNTISKLLDGRWMKVNTGEDIGHLVANYFRSFLLEQPVNPIPNLVEKLLDNIPTLLTNEDNCALL